MAAHVKVKTTVQLRAAAECPSRSLAQAAVRDLVFPCDEPVAPGVTLMEEIAVPFQAIHLQAIHLKVTTGKPLTDAELRRLSQEVGRYCPLSKLFKQAGTSVEEEWASA